MKQSLAIESDFVALETITRQHINTTTQIMKRLLVFLTTLLLLTACSEDKKELKNITRQFIALMSDGDNLRAGQLGTESTKRFLAYRTASMIELGVSTKLEMTVESIKCSVQNETAQCRFCCDPNGETFEVPYVKQNEKWLVDINIDEFIRETKEAQEKENLEDVESN